MLRCFGKLPARTDYRTPRLRAYLTAALPAPLPAYDAVAAAVARLGYAADPLGLFPLDFNDQWGDCTIAAAAHATTLFAARAGTENVVGADEVLAIYRSLTGGADNGLAELDVLKWWNANAIGGARLLAFASMQPANHDHIKLAIQLLGACYFGIQVPQSMQDDFESGAVMQAGPLSNDGHAILATGYDADTVSFLTWGGEMKMTWGCWDDCCDEAYVLLPTEAQDPGYAPGLDFAALQADLGALT